MKYRVWNNKNKGYENRDGVELLLTQDGQLLFSYFGLITEIEQSSYTIERCSELFDDNRTLIYEGDIVEVKLDAKTTYKSAVCFYNGRLVIDPHPSHIELGIGRMRDLVECCDYGFGGKDDVGCKIVGNVHEN